MQNQHRSAGHKNQFNLRAPDASGAKYAEAVDAHSLENRSLLTDVCNYSGQEPVDRQSYRRDEDGSGDDERNTGGRRSLAT